MKVTYIFRKPRLGNFSIEKVFENVIKDLPHDILPSTYVLPFFSSGFFKRLLNIIYCSFQSSDVFHITGDIHFVALGLKKKKTILTIHDLGLLNTKNPVIRTVLKYFWITAPIRNASIITTVSEFTKQEILKVSNVNPARVRVIYNPISANFVPAARMFNVQRPTILHIGTKENKNLKRLIEAISGLHCTLVIVGRLDVLILELLERLRVQYKNLVNLSDDEMRQQYIDCDIVAFVSTSEGFGLPIVEGNAIGRPVITGNTTSMPEVANGAACLVDPYSVTAIRDGIDRILNDFEFRNLLVSRGFENCKRFKGEFIAKQYSELYREIVNIT